MMPDEYYPAPPGQLKIPLGIATVAPYVAACVWHEVYALEAIASMPAKVANVTCHAEAVLASPALC